MTQSLRIICARLCYLQLAAENILLHAFQLQMLLDYNYLSTETIILWFCEASSYLGLRKRLLASLKFHFRVVPRLCFKARLSAKPLVEKWFFNLMQIKLIFTRKVLYLSSFWKLEFLNLGSSLFLDRWNRQTDKLIFVEKDPCPDKVTLMPRNWCQFRFPLWKFYYIVGWWYSCKIHHSVQERAISSV